MENLTTERGKEMEAKAGAISTWLSPNGKVYRVRVVDIQGYLFQAYRVDEKDEPLKGGDGICYPNFYGNVESLG
jgi:hypothetical protein